MLNILSFLNQPILVFESNSKYTYFPILEFDVIKRIWSFFTTLWKNMQMRYESIAHEITE